MKTTRKLIQALDYIAYHQHNRTVGFMKAYKLLWLIDRYSMRHYARTVNIFNNFYILKDLIEYCD